MSRTAFAFKVLLKRTLKYLITCNPHVLQASGSQASKLIYKRLRDDGVGCFDGKCPFCGMSIISSMGFLQHVRRRHLSYLVDLVSSSLIEMGYPEDEVLKIAELYKSRKLKVKLS